MLFEDSDREKSDMAAQKERQFTVRMDEETYDYLTKKAGEMDILRSEIIRASVLLSIHQLEAIPSLINVQLKDIRRGEKDQ